MNCNRAWFVGALPSFNELSLVSLVGACMSVCYCTIAVAMAGSIHPAAGSVNYDPANVQRTTIDRVMGIFNALTSILFAYGGHNVALEIQATIPITAEQPSTVKPMMRGVNITFVVTGLAYFAVSIVGFWAFGTSVADNVLMSFARGPRSWVVAMADMMVVVHVASAYQVYMQPVYQLIEYAIKRRTGVERVSCPVLSLGIRLVFVLLITVVAIVIPFFGSLMQRSSTERPAASSARQPSAQGQGAGPSRAAAGAQPAAQQGAGSSHAATGGADSSGGAAAAAAGAGPSGRPTAAAADEPLSQRVAEAARLVAAAVEESESMLQNQQAKSPCPGAVPPPQQQQPAQQPPPQQQRQSSPPPQHQPQQQPPPPPQQQGQQQQRKVVYKLVLSCQDVADQILSARTRRNLHQGPGQAIFVAPWLTAEQQQQRRRLYGSTTQQLQQQGVRWRWSTADPMQLEKRSQLADGRWHWVPVYPPPPGL